MTSIQATQNTIKIQPLYKWDSEESQMTYLNLYPKHKIYNILNVKMPTIVGILTFISIIHVNTTSESLEAKRVIFFSIFIF